MKNLENKKRLAADVQKCSPKRVVFKEDRLNDIKEAITKSDIRALIADGAITERQKKGVSRARAKKRDTQRSKGRQKGSGNRKGKQTARSPRKENWMRKIRTQREFLKELKTKNMLSKETFKNLYRKSKGGFFRNKRHIKTYITEHKLVTKNDK